MSTPEKSKDLKEVDLKQLAKFYAALGELNTTVVTRLNRDPRSLEALIADMFGFVKDIAYEDCKPGFRWVEARNACVSESELELLGG